MLLCASVCVFPCAYVWSYSTRMRGRRAHVCGRPARMCGRPSHIRLRCARFYEPRDSKQSKNKPRAPRGTNRGVLLAPDAGLRGDACAPRRDRVPA
eukprot:403619-Rhodomonas_salina.2